MDQVVLMLFNILPLPTRGKKFFSRSKFINLNIKLYTSESV